MHIIAYYANIATNSTLGILAVTTSLIITTALYGYIQLSHRSEKMSIRQSIAEEGTTFDMFSQVMDINDRDSILYEEGRNSSEVLMRTDSLAVSPAAGKPMISAFRAGWMKFQASQQQEQHSGGSGGGEGTETVENPLRATDSGASAARDRDAAIAYTNEVYSEREYGEGWFHAIPNYCKANQLLPKFAYPFKSKTAITARHRSLHFLCTFAFNLGWVLVYFILVVSDSVEELLFMLYIILGSLL